jgi:Clp amino terminal domain, pathogenicity island component
VAHQEPSGPYLAAIRRAFDFARQTGSGARGGRPVHFLVGIAEGEGPAAAALRPADGRSLRAIVTDMGVARGSPAGYLHMQAQQGAMALAAARGEPPGVEHLLVALLDQGTPEVLDALNRAGLDPAAIRQATLAALGAPADLPLIALGPATPAGTLDRPALPVADLNPRAWAVLRWRQEHLPISALHRRSDIWALMNLEHAAVVRVADQLALDDDQRYSLFHHHQQAVGERVAQARPDLGRPNHRRDRPSVGREARAWAVMRRRRYRWLRVTVGWGVWVGNRRMAVQNRWFRLRAAPAYRGAPQP